MAHLAPHLHQQTAAIFSPSVARAAASTAKDWSYVDEWLRRKYVGSSSSPPQFERNPETLKALLTLVAANEAADESRDQLARLEDAALDEVRAAQRRQHQKQQQQQQQQQATATKESGDDGHGDGEQIADSILAALEDGLSREGQTALDAMAQTALELGEARPTPEGLGATFVDLQGRAMGAEETARRSALLTKYLAEAGARTEALLARLRDGGDGEYAPDPDLARRNLELQRAVKAAAARLPEMRQQVDAAERAAGGPPNVTVDDIREDEEEYMELLAKKRDLDVRVKAFAGLPPDVQAARQELEALRTELRRLTELRDANFESLVERESPVKTRRRP
ncbi:hypothetical protein DL766_006034 [Monosporascus sp. MC13-8B]|uniref:Uncharacterized protein n=1 Tax=Monosporascus cannonballus TaxID=155416 RepID=A0ABY0H796_9PEZI|nr:hypothetical protein DL763_009166 [Monosporascus cannonballus]RYO86708.1 hypothetical protein DL762_004631 [Monosporascus cannonballus]RYP28138.1 hypothetical protein DL766_006034 [Monosporascus sp. MC13-8B]